MSRHGYRPLVECVARIGATKTSAKDYAAALLAVNLLRRSAIMGAGCILLAPPHGIRTIAHGIRTIARTLQSTRSCLHLCLRLQAQLQHYHQQTFGTYFRVQVMTLFAMSLRGWRLLVDRVAQIGAIKQSVSNYAPQLLAAIFLHSSVIVVAGCIQSALPRGIKVMECIRASLGMSPSWTAPPRAPAVQSRCPTQ